MDAFLFTLALFFFWGLVGFATISALNPRLRVVQGVLVSPAIGLAVTILLVFFINRAGIPVKDFGGTLLPALAAIAAMLVAWRRPVFPVKKMLPAIATLLAGLLLAARPMFSYGFDWVSFSNDDMANYCLGAQRFLNHGFFDQPNLDELFSGKDYSLTFWFMHVARGVRSGSDLMLAVVWAFSGLNAHQVFMPVIMALHLALIAGVGAMVAGARNSRRTPLIAMALLALSPLTTLGALYQLIGQLGGLALLSAVVTLMYRPFPSKQISKLFLGNVPAAITFAAIFVWYPEVLPFFGLGWLVFLGLKLKQGAQTTRQLVLPAVLIGAIVLLTLNKYLIAALTFMLGQASLGMKLADPSTVLFPYFLVPSGIAALWGLIPIAGDIREPFVSLAIAAGLALICWLVRRLILKQIQQATVPVSMLLVMVAMAAMLFYRNNGFGLFKLAMFIQPFLVGVIAIELGRLKWRGSSHVAKFTLVAVLIPAAYSQQGYVEKSTGEIAGGLNEIPYASSQKVNQQFHQLFDFLRNGAATNYLADTSNIVLAKYQALYSQGESLVFPSRNFFVNIADNSIKASYGTVTNAMESRYKELKNNQFIEYQIKTNAGTNKFLMLADGARQTTSRTLITTIEKQNIFNSDYKSGSKEYFRVLKQPVNHLVFIHSELGNHYYLGDRKKTAFYQLENDPMFAGQMFSALGEQLLFMVMGPTKKPRVVMELTDTVAKQFGSELPTPIVQSTKLGFVGRGTGRIYSDPIEPTLIDGMPFVSVDMARDSKQFPSSIKGLMLLYGRVIPADQRRITAFGRDISLISEIQYQSLFPPTSLKSFPSDLANRNLEYSGIYEDGWISETAFFVLSVSDSSKFLNVTGSIPQIQDPGFSTELKLSVNGKELATKMLGLGNFDVTVPVSGLEGRQRIDIAFSKHQQLPGEDGRITVGKIEFIGFK